MIVQCLCKCGTEFEEFDKKGHRRRFVKGHHSRGINHPNYGKHLSPETKQKIGIGNKDKIPWSKGLTKETNESLARRAENIKGENHPMYGKQHTPEAKQKISEKQSGENNHNYGKTPSDATKKKISDARKDKYSGENNSMFGKHHSPETKQKMREKHKGKVLSEEHRKNLSINHADNSGEKHWNWQGGISKEPYCQEWDKQLKEQIKERDDYQCKNSDCNKEITKINDLNVHHIDYNKKNYFTDNLITLCRSCNAKANFNRDYWKEFYNGLSKTKSMVI